MQEPSGRLFRASSDPNLRKEGTVRLEPGDPGLGPAQPYGVRPQVGSLNFLNVDTVELEPGDPGHGPV